MFLNIRQSFRTTFQSLLSNKIRSFLTILSIIIGVGAVILIMSVGASAQNLIISQVSTFGSNLIGVIPGKSEEGQPPSQTLGIVITSLTYDDVLELRKPKNAPNALAVAGYSRAIGPVSWGSNTYDTNITGVTSSVLDVEGGEVEQGRFLTEEEEKNLARVAVIGSEVKTQLFGESDAIGKKFKFRKHTFEVIGVMKQRGTVAFQNYDDQIYLPLFTVEKLINGVDHLGFIRLRVDNEANTDILINDIKSTLRETHGIKDSSGASDDFTVLNAQDALSTLTTVTDALKYFLAAMAALSLLVGGIGIMNIMLINVSERTREIGLRKAVGANTRAILTQFLGESIITTILGGIIGVMVGSFLASMIYIVASALGYSWNLIISVSSILIAIGVSALIGLIFGFFPALQASKKSPIEALRYE